MSQQQLPPPFTLPVPFCHLFSPLDPLSLCFRKEQVSQRVQTDRTNTIQYFKSAPFHFPSGCSAGN